MCLPLPSPRIKWSHLPENFQYPWNFRSAFCPRQSVSHLRISLICDSGVLAPSQFQVTISSITMPKNCLLLYVNNFHNTPFLKKSDLNHARIKTYRIWKFSRPLNAALKKTALLFFLDITKEDALLTWPGRLCKYLCILYEISKI